MVHLDHIVQLLQDWGHNQATDAAEEEAGDEEQLDNGGGSHRLWEHITNFDIIDPMDSHDSQCTSSRWSPGSSLDTEARWPMVDTMTP